MKKEEILTESLEVFSSSINETIETIAKKAFDTGFEEGYAKAKQDMGDMASRLVNVDGVEYHDIGMSDGSLVGVLTDSMTFFEASRYPILTVDQMKELLNRTRIIGDKLLFPDGYEISVEYGDFFWCAAAISDNSEIEGLRISTPDYGNYLVRRWGSCFIGKKGRVLFVKNKESN